MKSVLIFPNEIYENQKPFYISNLTNHAIGMKRFSDINKLGITEEMLGDKA